MWMFGDGALARGDGLCFSPHNPRCLGSMRIISLIDDSDVIKKILKHLGLWLPKRAPAPKANAPPKAVLIDYLDSQIPSADDYLINPDYPTDSWTN
jgi:hypothetical protein